jgi:hypothetical protein
VRASSTDLADWDVHEEALLARFDPIPVALRDGALRRR